MAVKFISVAYVILQVTKIETSREKKKKATRAKDTHKNE